MTFSVFLAGIFQPFL
jgi:hypothetical protein